MKILVTGSRGFIGSNLLVSLKEMGNCEVLPYDIGNSEEELEEALSTADIVYHLAGVNRPIDPIEFNIGNYGLTAKITHSLEKNGQKPILILSSSTQATVDNSYGESKRMAEDEVFSYAERTGAPVAVYRLNNVFGKWSRPNYNTVVATFCYNAARGIPLFVDEPENQIDFIFIDDIMEEFITYAKGRPAPSPGNRAFLQVLPVLRISLGKLANTINEIAAARKLGKVLDLAEPFARYLGSMFLTYLDSTELKYQLDRKNDHRGYLFEVLKSRHAGQVFMSVTKPEATRGNHYHHTKVEKIVIVKGFGLIKLRHILTGDVQEFPVRGEDCQAVDIPPGFAHSITNVGSDEMIVLFWANEIFDPDKPDTFPMET